MHKEHFNHSRCGLTPLLLRLSFLPCPSSPSPSSPALPPPLLPRLSFLPSPSSPLLPPPLLPRLSFLPSPSSPSLSDIVRGFGFTVVVDGRYSQWKGIQSTLKSIQVCMYAATVDTLSMSLPQVTSMLISKDVLKE